ncbi:hypothetical protein GCM10023091_34510 [Ravibacter arvi]|uniref:DUF4286 domain-containing protein n=1 Tax=Ravibacter arvi TaxID=2051041 RepID=A0ABP8M6Q4_9BACT
MIIHNTTYSVAPPAEAKWVLWVQEHHVPAIHALPGVSSCRFLKLLTEVEQDGITYTIQVELADLDAGEAFLQAHDPVFQAEMQEHFPGQVLYFQTLLKVM